MCGWSILSKSTLTAIFSRIYIVNDQQIYELTDFMSNYTIISTKTLYFVKIYGIKVDMFTE